MNHLDCNIIYDTVESRCSRDFDLKSKSSNSAFFWILLFMILLVGLISLIIQPLLYGYCEILIDRTQMRILYDQWIVNNEQGQEQESLLNRDQEEV